MPATQIGLDISSFSVATVDQKAFLRSGTLKFTNTTADGRSIVQRHANPVKAARGVEVTASLMENVSGVNRATLKDVTAFTLGGNSFAGYLSQFSFNRTCSHKSAQGDGTEHTFPVWTGNDTTISATINIPLGDYPDFIAALDVDGQAAADLAFSITANGGTLTIAAMVLDVTNSLEVDGLQQITLNLGGRLEASAPSGTSSLLAAAINAPETAVAISVVTKGTNGSTWAGNGLVSSITYSGTENGLLMTDVTYVSVGSWSIS